MTSELAIGLMVVVSIALVLAAVALTRKHDDD